MDLGCAFRAVTGPRLGRLQLNRDVPNIEPLSKFAAYLAQELVTTAHFVDYEMGGQGDFDRAQPPNMQVMDFDHPRQRSQIFADPCGIRVFGDAVESEVN
jgi:hypothetical protein